MKNAVILCSGGLDSVTTAYYVEDKLDYDKLTVLFFNYGQKSLLAERKFSKKCASDLKAKFIEIDLPWLGRISNSLINKPGKVKKLGRKDLKNTKKESQNWYVPFRNAIFLSHAIALAEAEYLKSKNVNDIFVGFKCEGLENYPDTTTDFVKAMNKLAEISCAFPFEINAPLIKKDKEEIIRLGLKLGVDFKKTFSCFIGKKKHCGYCLACKLRKEGFYWANIKDPTEYSEKE